MKFTTTIFTAVCAAAVASANGVIQFVGQDATDRTIVCVPQAGQQAVPNTNLPGGKTIFVTFPEHWIGNCVTCEGLDQQCDPNGMLLEVSFGSWNDITFYDVSAIVKPGDVNNVQAIMPVNGDSPVAGCTDGNMSECPNMYVKWNDDYATKSTDENDLICLVGTPTSTTKKSRRGGPVARSLRAAARHLNHLAEHAK